jgi:hypothetical protein
MVDGARLCGLNIGDVEATAVAREHLGGGGRINGDLEVAVVGREHIRGEHMGAGEKEIRSGKEKWETIFFAPPR